MGPDSVAGSPKHDVAEFLRPNLLFAALTCADATHELAHPSFPGTAGSTMLVPRQATFALFARRRGRVSCVILAGRNSCT